MTGERDPFDAVFDASFIASAPVQEGTAAERMAELRLAEQRRRAQLDELQALRRREAGLRRRQRRRRRNAVIVVLGALALLVAATTMIDPDPERGFQVAGGDTITFDGTVTSIPDPPADQADGPLRSVPEAPDSDAYELMMTDRATGEPVRYMACRPIHVVVYGGDRVPDSDALLDEVLEVMSAATGLVFMVEGPTDEGPTEKRDAVQPGRYGDRWAPVLFAWTDPETLAGLAGDVAGQAGSQAMSVNGAPSTYVTGIVHIDAPDALKILDQPEGRDHLRGVLLHELAHLVGLDHIDDPDQLMYERMTGRTTFADGDLAGLSRLGGGPCHDEL